MYRSFPSRQSKTISLCLIFSYIGVLLLVFFHQVGIESFIKFLARQKFVIESFREFTNSDHPAITVCASNGLHGWRDGSIFKNPFEELCSASTNAKEAYHCININTFNLSDLVSGAVDGNREAVNESEWKIDISSVNKGKCFTLSWYKYRAQFENDI